MTRLSSRERMLAAIRYEEPDHVPLVFNCFGFAPPPHLAWKDQYEQARSWLSLEVDAWLHVSPPIIHHPAVQVREWVETTAGERFPVMIKEYETPAGPFRQEVYRTDDWVSPDWPGHKAGDSGVHLLDDYNVARSRRFPVRTEEDIEKLRYLLWPADGDALARFRAGAAVVARHAEELGVLLVGGGVSGADMATWLCGAMGMVEMAIDRPQLFDALLDVIHAADKRAVELLLDTPVDFILGRGYYQGTTFWSPALFRRFFAPRLRQLASMIHEGGRLMGYTMSVGVMPLLADLAQIGYDAHYLLDPIERGAPIDLRKVKTTLGGAQADGTAAGHRTAVIGGLNEPITLEAGTPEAIRQQVRAAVEHLGTTGLCLSPAEAIMYRTPWESIETLLSAWREVREV